MCGGLDQISILWKLFKRNATKNTRRNTPRTATMHQFAILTDATNEQNVEETSIVTNTKVLVPGVQNMIVPGIQKKFIIIIAKTVTMITKVVASIKEKVSYGGIAIPRQVDLIIQSSSAANIPNPLFYPSNTNCRPY